MDSKVISGVAVDYVGIDVREKFGDSSSNGSQGIREADFVSNSRTNAAETYHVRQMIA